MTIRPLLTPVPRRTRLPLTVPPSNPPVDKLEFVRRLDALERVLGR